MIATIHYSTFSLEIVERLTLGARDLAERFLFGVDPLDRFALLVGREGWLPAEPNTVRGAHPAFAGASADKIALELGQAAEHRKHAGRASGQAAAPRRSQSRSASRTPA